METMMGLINLGDEHDFFNELTYFRNSATLPFAGRYRLIDFPLSNMRHSDIEEIAVFTPNKYRSLMDHIKSGSDWGIGRHTGGLFILPPDWHDPTDISKGDLRFFHNNRDYFARGKSSYVLVSGSQFVSNTEYQSAFQSHLKNKADVTLITTPVEKLQPEHASRLRSTTNDTGRVTEVTHDSNNHQLFTGVYIMNKDLLLHLVEQCIAYHKTNFFVEGIIENLNKLHVQAYENAGYGVFINSMESFYRQNMNLLSPDQYKALFHKNTLVRTKIGNQPPTKYRKNAKVKNSIIANGSIIDGEVENSVLFRGVHIKAGATVKNAIIMQRCTIEEDVHIENIILDKDVQVAKAQQLMGTEESPFVVAKNKTI